MQLFNYGLMAKETEVLEQRVQALEEMLGLRALDNNMDERLSAVKVQVYSNKNALTFAEACTYLDVSQSLLYKLTSTNAIPHYKPRGKMVYFSRAELDKWMLTNHSIIPITI